MKRGLTGSTLKTIALFSMLIDHFTAVFEWGSMHTGSMLFTYEEYYFLRGVGRLAFPIYCFLLVEGYVHTRNVAKYLVRLFLFGLVSEIPFDLAFRHTFLVWSYQNVYFTLFLGLLAVTMWDFITKKDPRHCGMGRILLALSAIAFIAFLGRVGNTDYGEWGVLTISALYIFRSSEWLRDLFSAGALLMASRLEAVGFVEYVLFHFYNGERGRQPKYFFYLFYPVHLLLLVLICRAVFGV